MKRLILSQFSIRHPKTILALAAVLTIAFAFQFPKVRFDNDPENMLAEDEPIRVLHNRIKQRYDLYDFVIVGIVNEAHPDGIFNVETLGKIYDLSAGLMSLSPGTDGKPSLTLPARGTIPERIVQPDLLPKTSWARLLATAFRHDPEALFDEEGRSVIIAREIISPASVDNIRQAQRGQLAIEYLMEKPPLDREEALRIRDDALNNPLYRGTLVSEDGKAMALYIPIKAKPYGHNVAHLIDVLTREWPGSEQWYITGQPVAQDTFGVEMLVQMATSAPMAGLAIFVLLFLFFRRFSLIIAPMIVAGISVVVTMGLLIGLGFDVHIMSSMIAIFLMPIAVADSVHILSEFFDTYHRFGDRGKTILSTIGHLFQPMLFTTLTTVAGFASLALTPIPPVRVFGIHVAFGVGFAWFLTMTLVPAYLMLFVSDKSLAGLAGEPRQEKKDGLLAGFLIRLGRFAHMRRRGVAAAALLLLSLSIYGVTKIRINDNPVKWFDQAHPIRVADRVLNRHFGGTYTAYLNIAAAEGYDLSRSDRVEQLNEAAAAGFGAANPSGLTLFLDAISQNGGDFSLLAPVAERLDRASDSGWRDLADAINYLDPETLDWAGLEAAVRLAETPPESVQKLLNALRDHASLSGEGLHEKALDMAETLAPASFAAFLTQMEVQLTAPLFKRPEMLAYVHELQNFLRNHPMVGKTNSAVDVLRKANFELQWAPAMAGEDVDAVAARNDAFMAIPATSSAIGQVFTQLEGMKKKDSLFHLVTKDYRQVNLWIQLKSGDNMDMLSVKKAVDGFFAEHRAPVPLVTDWAGLTYLNVVWQDRMVSGMLSALLGSFVVVFLLMVFLFRSFSFGLLSMIPLSMTILFIYGLIGWIGKDYDMPAAILSALTLGLSIDFAIHFLQRARELHKQTGSWQAVVPDLFREPAMAISRNAVIISVGFTPLLFAPLIPYQTVGFFLATIMVVSWLATLFLLTALVTLSRRFLFKEK